MTRTEALERMKKIYSVEDPKVIDLCIKRLGLTQKDIDIFLKEKPKNFLYYKSNFNLIKIFKYPIKILSKLYILPPSLYYKFFSD